MYAFIKTGRTALKQLKKSFVSLLGAKKGRTGKRGGNAPFAFDLLNIYILIVFTPADFLKGCTSDSPIRTIRALAGNLQRFSFHILPDPFLHICSIFSTKSQLSALRGRCGACHFPQLTPPCMPGWGPVLTQGKAGRGSCQSGVRARSP